MDDGCRSKVGDLRGLGLDGLRRLLRLGRLSRRNRLSRLHWLRGLSGLNRLGCGVDDGLRSRRERRSCVRSTYIGHG